MEGCWLGLSSVNARGGLGRVAQEVRLETLQTLISLMIVGGIVAAVVVLVRKIMAVPPRPEYDLPPTTVGETRFDRRERDEMSRRARRLPPKIKFQEDQEIWFHGLDAARRTADAYKPTYELMMRGLGVQLIVQEIYRDSPGDRRDFFANTFTYTTQLLEPYAAEIGSLEDFGGYVPWRESGAQGVMQSTRYEYHLYLFADDREEAFEVLKGLRVHLECCVSPGPGVVARRTVYQAENARLTLIACGGVVGLGGA